MKRITLLSVALLATIIMFAQDIIVTKNAQKITANITEVSSDCVKYLDVNMPDGPVFVLYADEISSVIFANGTVKLYEPTTEKSLVVKPETLYRVGNKYIYGDVAMKGRQYAQFLQENCKSAYAQYENGRKLSTAGWCLFGSGLFMLNVVVPICAIYAEISAISIGTIFSAALITSIPLLSVGYTQMHSSANVFNLSSREPQAYWSINASQNGLGLALNF